MKKETKDLEHTCEDKYAYCLQWTNPDFCKLYSDEVRAGCKKSCNLCNTLDKGYVKSCEDKNEFCKTWARQRKCTNIPGYMAENCKKSCKLSLLRTSLFYTQGCSPRLDAHHSYCSSARSLPSFLQVDAHSPLAFISSSCHFAGSSNRGR
ncbi:hypothetical protein RRG08_063882 [Elysia crispata]|uniref:ShKT domain-containing protein n=1 Tax=Elysia crispata TaxID=231223 RepID=A0AAE0YQH4_9GAST|nr:hypothetical protein RRG08_063882 [Elysia crispata]